MGPDVSATGHTRGLPGPVAGAGKDDRSGRREFAGVEGSYSPHHDAMLKNPGGFRWVISGAEWRAAVRPWSGSGYWQLGARAPGFRALLRHAA